MHMRLSRAGEGCAASQEQWWERVCVSPSAAAWEGGDAFLRGSKPGVVARRGVQVHERSGVGGCTLRGGCEAGYCKEWQRGVERCIPGQSKSGAAARRGMRTMAARRGSAVIR